MFVLYSNVWLCLSLHFQCISEFSLFLTLLYFISSFCLPLNSFSLSQHPQCLLTGYRRSWIVFIRTWWPRWRRWTVSSEHFSFWHTTTNWSSSPKDTAHLCVTSVWISCDCSILIWVTMNFCNPWKSMLFSRFSYYSWLLFIHPGWCSRRFALCWEVKHGSCCQVERRSLPPHNASWMCVFAAQWVKDTAWRRPAVLEL